MDIVPKDTQFEESVDKYVSDLLPFLSEAALECTAINRKPKGSKASRFVDATLETFEIIGGVARFALWADSNPEAFYTKNVAKAASIAQNQINFNGPTQINIIPALPRSPLDGPDTQDAIDCDAGE